MTTPTPPPPVGAVVSLDAMYQLLVEVRDKVSPLVDKVGDLQNRVASLERWRYTVAAISTAGGGAFGYLLQLTGKG